ncbi:MAG: uracil-DNA glycosylase family protein [Phycisphaerae bacterium]
MSEHEIDIQSVREILRGEKRLGVTHWAVPATLAQPTTAGATTTSPTRTAAPVSPPQRVAPPRSESQRQGPQPAPPRSHDLYGAPAPIATPRPRPAAAPLPIADADELPPICQEELSVEAARAALALIDEQYVRGCRKCVLHSGRTQTVFGVGNPRPDVAFVGEGPGADEDIQGEPFVGRAGQLLTRMIAAMQLTREQVYICNVVKCRPPGNRTPEEAEMHACAPYLFRQLAILRPKVIVALGRPASQTLLATSTPIGKLRGEFHDFPPPALAHFNLPRCKLMPTFHPAYLLRSPDEKAKSWDDLKQVMGLLGIAVPRRGGAVNEE